MRCSDPRWSKYTDPVTGRTVGQQLMLNQSFKTSMGYKWGGLAVVIFASFLFNGLIWLALAVLKGSCFPSCLGRGQCAVVMFCSVRLLNDPAPLPLYWQSRSS